MVYRNVWYPPPEIVVVADYKSYHSDEVDAHAEAEAVALAVALPSVRDVLCTLTLLFQKHRQFQRTKKSENIQHKEIS